MSDELNWTFSGPDGAKAETRAAVGYLLKVPPVGIAMRLRARL